VALQSLRVQATEMPKRQASSPRPTIHQLAKVLAAGLSAFRRNAGIQPRHPGAGPRHFRKGAGQKFTLRMTAFLKRTLNLA
jgi:hypothetical protein